MVTKKLKVLIIAVVVALVSMYGILDAIKDTLAHHYSGSIFENYNQNFWNVNLSWCNKWENCEVGKEKFLGSSSVFSFLTDGWHLVKFFQLRIWLIFPALFLADISNFKNQFLNRYFIRFLIFYIGLAIVQSLMFTLFYHHLLLK